MRSAKSCARSRSPSLPPAASSSARSASPRSAARFRLVRDCSMAGGLVREEREVLHIRGAGGGSPFLVEQLEDTYDLIFVEEGHAEDALRRVADALGDVGGLARVVLRVRDGHRLAAHGDESGNAVAQRHAKFLHLFGLRSQCNLEDQL